MRDFSTPRTKALSCIFLVVFPRPVSAIWLLLFSFQHNICLQNSWDSSRHKAGHQCACHAHALSSIQTDATWRTNNGLGCVLNDHYHHSFFSLPLQENYFDLVFVPPTNRADRYKNMIVERVFKISLASIYLEVPQHIPTYNTSCFGRISPCWNDWKSSRVVCTSRVCLRAHSTTEPTERETRKTLCDAKCIPYHVPHTIQTQKCA